MFSINSKKSYSLSFFYILFSSVFFFMPLNSFSFFFKSENLFSIFNPATSLGSFNLPLNWVSLLVLTFFIFPAFWLAPSQVEKSFQISAGYLNSEFKSILNKMSVPGMPFLTLSMLYYIVLNNFLGLCPYIFTATSHLSVASMLALPLWLGYMAFSWFCFTEKSLAHLVPGSTPYALMPFMVLIELVSNSIRPLTLSVRLAANMIAGHLLLTLLGNQGPSISWWALSGLMLGLLSLTFLECAVSVIQGYVFSVLSTLYTNEANSYSMMTFNLN